MREGKIPNELLEKLISNNRGMARKEIISGPGIGRDCGVIDFGEDVCVISTDPITGAINKAGYLAVHISCNDIATTGALPFGIMVTIMAPTKTSYDDMETIMEDIDEACNELDVGIIGGHTEVTRAVNQVVLSVTALGKIPKDKLVDPSRALVGDDILISKTAGLEGTAIIAYDGKDYLSNYLDEETILRAQRYIDDISVVKEGKIAGENGVHTMHDITEGGVLGALYETSIAMDKGMEIEISKIPIADETKVICELLELDPLRLISSGSMIMITPDANLLIEKLKNQGIEASKIGKVTEGKDIILRDGKTKRKLTPPKGDELHKALEIIL